MTNPPSAFVPPNSEPGPRVSRRGGRLGALLVLLLVAVAGGFVGAAVDRLCFTPRMFGGPPHHRGFRDRFAREVGLSPDQQTRIDSIMDREGRELRAVRGRVQPQLDSIITRTRRQLDSVLTPEQRKKAEEIRKRHPRPPGPGGPDGFPSGPPPDGPPPR